VTRNGPDEKDRCDGIDQRQQQTTVERWGRPERRRRAQPESAREQCAVRHAGIAEETIHRVEHRRQPPRIALRRQTAACQVPAQAIIGGTFVRSRPRQDGGIASEDHPERDATAGDSKHRQRRHRGIEMGARLCNQQRQHQHQDAGNEAANGVGRDAAVEWLTHASLVRAAVGGGRCGLSPGGAPALGQVRKHRGARLTDVAERGVVVTAHVAQVLDEAALQVRVVRTVRCR
jgi:hypothetical protein